MMSVEGLGAQVVATTLDPGQPLFQESPSVFLVEHGRVTAAA